MPTAAYIGTVAHPVPIEWIDGVRVSSDGRYSVQSAPARTWVFATRAQGLPAVRSWDVTARVGNATMSNLEALAAGAFGNAPLLWMPESAYVTNAITPPQSLLFDVVGAGAGVGAVEGWAPRSALGPGPTVLADGTPVLPGQPVTVSADAAGPTVLKAVFRNAAGVAVSTGSVSATGTAMQRLHFTTGAAPSTARTVDVVVEGHTAATRPQVTWTRGPTPWAPGAGAASVVVEKIESQTLYLEGRGDLLMSVGMTIQEVE